MDQLSLWEIQACIAGYRKAHENPAERRPTLEEHNDLVERYRHLDF